MLMFPTEAHLKMPCLHAWGPQTHTAYQGPWEDCRRTHCPEQAQMCGQTRSLRAFYPVGAGNTLRMEVVQPGCAPAALLGFLHGEKPFPYPQAEDLLLQSMIIASHPPAVWCSEEQFSLLSNLLIDIGGEEGTARMGLPHGGHKQGPPSTGSAHSSVRLVTVTSAICRPKQGEITSQSLSSPRNSSHKQQKTGIGVSHARMAWWAIRLD